MASKKTKAPDFGCCGGTDETPKEHTQDCSVHGDPDFERKAIEAHAAAHDAAKAKKKAKKAAPKTSITAAYLIWVGSESYKGIADWSDEAIALGVSKRLPGVALGRKLMDPGCVVFVAHDEGEMKDCPDCMGKVECPRCRKAISEMAGLRSAIDKMKAAFKGEDFDAEASDGNKRFVRVREARIEALERETEECEDCKGKGFYKAGTGGHVTLVDGRKWDYRTFNYWLHQPKKFHPDTQVVSREMCESCGGTGDLPCGRIFGLFAPDRIEYILRGDETPEELKAVKGLAIVKTTKGEPERKCGHRKPGGVYAVTKVSAEASPRALKIMDDLVTSGMVKPRSSEVHGAFIRFHRQMPIAEKRFRGLKKIDLATVAKAAEQAELVRDALE
jgi:hypothetical protein